jgi:hypothetical protein
MTTSWSSKPSEEIKNQVEEIISDKIENLVIKLCFLALIILLLWGAYHLGYNNGLLFNLGG